MQPREFVDKELKLVTEAFNIMKELSPTVFFIKNDNRVTIPANFNSDAQKDIVSQGIRELVKGTMPDIVIYVSEAWAVVTKDPEKEIRPMFNPKRIEVLVVQIEFKSGEMFGCSANIIRDGKEPRLGEFRIIDNKMDTGRFTNFFPPKSVN